MTGRLTCFARRILHLFDSLGFHHLTNLTLVTYHLLKNRLILIMALYKHGHVLIYNIKCDHYVFSLFVWLYRTAIDLSTDSLIVWSSHRRLL